jgi:hypothetical protein
MEEEHKDLERKKKVLRRATIRDAEMLFAGVFYEH